MKKENLSWLFISLIAVIVASIVFSILSMTQANDPINTVFMIIHSITLLTVIGCWIYDAKQNKGED